MQTDVGVCLITGTGLAVICATGVVSVRAERERAKREMRAAEEEVVRNEKLDMLLALGFREYLNEPPDRDLQVDVTRVDWDGIYTTAKIYPDTNVAGLYWRYSQKEYR